MPTSGGRRSRLHHPRMFSTEEGQSLTARTNPDLWPDLSIQPLEDQWEPRPKMTPHKIERGRQSSYATGQELSRFTSQKRHSQSQPRDEADPKKGSTESDGRTSKVQVGIDWSVTGIQKPVPKLDPKHPSFKPDSLGDSTTLCNAAMVPESPETPVLVKRHKTEEESTNTVKTQVMMYPTAPK